MSNWEREQGKLNRRSIQREADYSVDKHLDKIRYLDNIYQFIHDLKSKLYSPSINTLHQITKMLNYRTSRSWENGIIMQQCTITIFCQYQACWKHRQLIAGDVVYCDIISIHIALSHLECAGQQIYDRLDCHKLRRTICSNRFWTKIVKSCAFSGTVSLDKLSAILLQQLQFLLTMEIWSSFIYSPAWLSFDLGLIIDIDQMSVYIRQFNSNIPTIEFNFNFNYLATNSKKLRSTVGMLRYDRSPQSPIPNPPIHNVGFLASPGMGEFWVVCTWQE